MDTASPESTRALVTWSNRPVMARAHRKDSLRIEAIGAVDELNSAIGLLLAEPQARTFGR